VTFQQSIITIPSPEQIQENNMKNILISGACFGFAAPDDHVVSLNIAAALEDGQKHPSYSFDIEYDAEQPDHVVIRLLELDRHSFIQTVQRSISFPVGMLLDLVNKRKATSDEVAAWQAAGDDE